jgi:uncharacterized protein (UPF0335 family)
MTRSRFEGGDRDEEKWRMPHIMLDRIASKRHDLGQGRRHRNSGGDTMTDTNGTTANGAQLRGIVERIERLEEEKAQVSEQIKEVYAEAKGNGFDPKILRKVVAMRKLTPDERAEVEAIMDLYWQAIDGGADA